MVAGVCLTLGVLYFLVWVRMRSSWETLLFAIAAIAAAVVALQDLSLIHSRTPAEFGQTLRWMHVSVAVLVISLVWFIRLYLRSGRRWLAWLISGMRALIMLPNFLLVYPNATYQQIDSLRSMSLLGETLFAPVGEMNPWRYLIQASTLLLLF